VIASVQTAETGSWILSTAEHQLIASSGKRAKETLQLCALRHTAGLPMCS